MAELVAAPGRHTTVDPQVELRLSRAGRLFRWLAVGYAIIGLLGRFVPPLRDLPPAPGFTRYMPTASAISLAVLAFGALLAGDVTHSVGSSVVWRRIGSAMTLGAGLFGAVILFVFFTGMTDIWGAYLAIPAFSTGLVLVMLGVAVPLSVSRIESRVVAGQVATLLVFSLSGIISLGYIYGDPTVGQLILRPEISFQETIISVLTAVGAFLIRPASGLLSVTSSPSAGGRVLRWFGPVVLLTPALLILITETVPSTDRISVLAFVAVGLGLFLLVLLSFFVRALDQTAIEAATSAAEAERARVGLSQEAPVVNRMSELFHLVDVGTLEGWEVATRFRPGRGSVAGDASAVHILPDGAVGVVMVDVTGHGADPAVEAIRMRDLLLHSLVAGKTPAEATRLVEWSAPDDFLASALVARVDPETGKVRLCSAGHPPALVVRAQDAELKPPTGPLLYLDRAASYGEHEFGLGPGDALVTFSDGVADVQRDRNGRTQPEMLADLLLAEGGAASRTADLILGFGDPEPGDDQSVVVIRRTV